jgi:hypothetical protein
MSSPENVEEKTRRPIAPVPGAAHLTLYTAPDAPNTQTDVPDTPPPPCPQGPNPPHYERRGARRDVSKKQNQQQVLLGLGVGIFCTLSVVGIVLVPFLYQYYSERKPYFADAVLFTALLTVVVALTSTLTLVTLVAIAVGLLFAKTLEMRERGYATVYDMA